MADWRQFSNNIYIDSESILEIGDEIYQCWTKEDKNSRDITNLIRKYDLPIEYMLSQIFVNVRLKQCALKWSILYNKYGQVLFEHYIDDYDLYWSNIPPDSKAEILYNMLIGKYPIPQKEPTAGCLALINIVIVIFFIWFLAKL